MAKAPSKPDTSVPVEVKTTRTVVQANPLLTLGYRLTDRAQRLLRLVISQIDDKRDADFCTYEFKTSELYNALGLGNSGEALDLLRKAVRELRRADVSIPAELTGGVIVETGLIIEGRIHPWEGWTALRVSEYLKPFLLEIKQNFLKYGFKEIQFFRGDYTLRFYEWFLAERFKATKSGTWYVCMELHEIRRRLGMLDAKGHPLLYPRWQDFRRRVLDPVAEEISEKSAYLVSWEAGQKRRITDVKFHISPKPKTGDATRATRPVEAKPAAAVEVESEEKRVQILGRLLARCGEDLREAVKERHAEDFAKLRKSGLLSAEMAERQAEASAILAFEDQIRAVTEGRK
jgi:plasmid replication initiation protein